MSLGTWLVLCRGERLVSLVEIVPRLARMKGARIDEVEPEYMVVVVDDAMTGNTAPIEVFVDDQLDIAGDAARLAQHYADRADRDAIAAADARYAMTWELEYGDETYNTMCLLAEVLAKACDGIVYDATDGRIVWSAVLDGGRSAS